MSRVSALPRPEVRRSDAAFVTHERAFGAVLGDAPRLVHVVDTDAHEGPVYVPGEDALYYTSLPRPGSTPSSGPRVEIARIALDGLRFPLEPDRITVVRPAANAANGMALDPDGRHLLVCEQGTPTMRARIARVDPTTGDVDTVVDGWEGLRFNSPNDVAVAPDGSIWFTDPSYGYLQGFKPEPEVGDYVYRYDPATGGLAVVADGFDKPNGIAFSPDGSVLYVTDSGANQTVGSFHVDRPHHIVAFDVVGRHLRGERPFAVTTPGFPDGITTDETGRVYASSFRGVQVFSPEGDLLGEIRLPGAVNFDFGGPDGNVLFVTTDTAVWAAVLGTRGA
jgi:gluconolactonase